MIAATIHLADRFAGFLSFVGFFLILAVSAGAMFSLLCHLFFPERFDDEYY